MKVVVLRLGHRGERDQRVTTHVCLTARAFGAEGVYLTTKDEDVKRNLEDVVKRWGGSFWVRETDNWKKVIKKWKEGGGVVCHLTMYGQDMEDVINKIKGRDVLFVVGAEKVPPEIYKISDYNVAIGHQPHSEISALAVALYMLMPDALKKRYPDARIEVLPSERGKKVVRK
jgi:tRNA (cytidine56-2'-O)-methyltransferase